MFVIGGFRERFPHLRFGRYLLLLLYVSFYHDGRDRRERSYRTLGIVIHCNWMRLELKAPSVTASSLFVLLWGKQTLSGTQAMHLGTVIVIIASYPLGTWIMSQVSNSYWMNHVKTHCGMKFHLILGR